MDRTVGATNQNKNLEPRAKDKGQMTRDQGQSLMDRKAVPVPRGPDAI